MRIDVWADIVCPFCWIGRRHLQQALEEEGMDAELVHRPFQLDPSRTQVAPLSEYLQERFGDSADAANQHVAHMGREAGLEFRFDRAVIAPTMDAHRVVLLAQEDGRQDVVLERIMSAYFTEGADISDHDVLVTLATEAGLDAPAVRALLASERFRDTVREDHAEAQRLGATGVPFVVLDQRLGVLGAQPVAAFRDALRRAKETGSAPT